MASAEALTALLKALCALEGDGPSRAQYVDWAYGQTKLSNPAVTREMAERAVNEFFAAKQKVGATLFPICISDLVETTTVPQPT